MSGTGTTWSRRWKPGLVGVALALAAGSAVVPLGPAVAAPDPGMSVAPMPVSAVSLANAGEVSVWGPNNLGQATVPASLTGVAVSQVVVADSVVLALTAAGHVVGWGGNEGRLQRIPDVVSQADVAQIAIAVNDDAGAVTRDGRVLTWGVATKLPSPLDVPAGLTGVKQLVLTPTRNALALKTDGSVVAWGRNEALNQVPAGLRATAIVAGDMTAYALTEQGTVVGWGDGSSSQLNLPASVQQPGNVKAIAALGYGAVAVLADNTIVAWGSNATTSGGAHWFDALQPVSVTAKGAFASVVDVNGVIHYGLAQNSTESDLVPAALNGRALAQLSLGVDRTGAVVITKMLRGADPTVAGTTTVGSTLTATPGTFSASPESVTGQWLANGAAIPGATGTTLSLTTTLVGKQVTYRSTATKTGETTISSTSAPVTVTTAAPPPITKVTSTTKVAKVAIAKGAKSVVVTGKVAAAKSVVGKAKVTIKKGKTTIVSTAVAVSSKGALRLTVKNFAKLVAKKTKAKGKKAKTAYRGKYVITIAYAGNAQVKPGTGSKAFKIKK